MKDHSLETVYEIHNHDLQGAEKIVVCEGEDGLDLTEIRNVLVQSITNNDVKYTGECVTDRITLQEDALLLLIEALQKRLADIRAKKT